MSFYLENGVLMSEEIYDIIIIGGGPAGLTAAIYSARHNMKTLILESNKLGGKAIEAHWVENYPGYPEGISGYNLMKKFIYQAEKFGAKVEFETVVGFSDFGGFKMVSTRKGFYQAKTIVIATGITRKQLSVPGENEFKGRGVSYCAVCDGPFFLDKNIAIIGSGHEAVHDAILLSRTARKVFAIPGSKGYNEEIEELDRIYKNPKIDVLEGYEISIIGGDNLVNHIILKGANEVKLDVDAVFLILEHVSISSIISDIGIEVDSGGCIITNNIQETNIEGIFAAGDCSCKGMQIITAAGMGANAALAAMKYVKSSDT
jgi:thioredoxin reductase (NADPH)